jgi:hypothetical protein
MNNEKCYYQNKAKATYVFSSFSYLIYLNPQRPLNTVFYGQIIITPKQNHPFKKINLFFYDNISNYNPGFHNGEYSFYYTGTEFALFTQLINSAKPLDIELTDSDGFYLFSITSKN